MTLTAVAMRPLTPEQQTELAQRLGRWRRQPLPPEDLAALLPRITDPHLALAVGERLGMAGPGAIALILPLCRNQGITLPLIRALGICHHPEARDQLLHWLDQAGELKAAVLEALACWGNQIDLSIITTALQAPAQTERLAGLALLTFRSRSLDAAELLGYTQPLLNDLRLDVIIATIRLLQRRQEPCILAALDGCIDDQALPGVAEAAIQALGCIGTEDSCLLLINQLHRHHSGRLSPLLQRQLRAQVRHRHWVQARLEELHLDL